MYFASDPSFANNGSVPNLWVTVEYFDEGTGAFRLEYDAQPDPNNVNLDTDPYTVSNGAENNGLIKTMAELHVRFEQRLFRQAATW
jgi:hypothetical protein